MFSKLNASLLATSALTLALVGGFAATAAAQVGVFCQYFTGQFDPLDIQSEISEPFWIPATAVETNSQFTRITKASGTAEAEFSQLGAVEGGMFIAEVQANFKRLNNDPSTTCPNKATVRGAGEITLAGDDFVIRSNSKMDGKPRVGTVISGPVGENEINSIHRVNANIRYTGQGERNNGSWRFARGSINTAGVYEAFEQSPRETDEDVLLICTCLDELEQ